MQVVFLLDCGDDVILSRLTDSPEDVAIMLAVYALAALPFEVVDTNGHQRDRIRFGKWNSLSAVAAADRDHGSWALSPTCPNPESLFGDIDSSSPTPILEETVGPRMQKAY